MALFDSLRRIFAAPQPTAKVGRANFPIRIRAKYDAAQTTSENREHWAQADSLASVAALNPQVRAIIRNRARYEIANNSYASGIVRTLANDTIGTGPTVRFLTGSRVADKFLDDLFWQWYCRLDLRRSLWTMRFSRTGDGEVFGRIVPDFASPLPIKSGFRVFESDQFDSPFASSTELQQTGGISIGPDGRPTSYSFLKEHPGGSLGFSLSLEADTIPARDVIHWFMPERPGQVRGVSEITPALPLFAQLRRYTLAVVAAAETAADYAAVLQSKGLEADPESWEPLDEIEVTKRMMTVLPDGYELKQFEPEQPTSTHDAFTKAIIREIARCLSMPFNIAAGDSSGYNYASGRLDQQIYYKSRSVDRESCREQVIEPLVWRGFWPYAVRVTPDLPEPMRRGLLLPTLSVSWPGDKHVDPKKEADSAVTLIEANLFTEREHAIERNADWEEVESQRATELGVTVDEFRRLKREKLFGNPVPKKPQPIDKESDDE